MKIRLCLPLFLLLAGCATGAAVTGRAPIAGSWTLFTMDQQAGGGYGDFLWKPVETFPTGDACRVAVRARADRGPIAPIGLIAWYPLPDAPGHWIGCLPFGYDPYERR